jgi:hypothetical protein
MTIVGLEPHINTDVEGFFLGWGQEGDVRTHVPVSGILKVAGNFWIQTNELGEGQQVGGQEIHAEEFKPEFFGLILIEGIPQGQVPQAEVRTIVQPLIGVDPGSG